ncbi:hypothetical protein ACN47E_002899 [Coniothyrium glycines]
MAAVAQGRIQDDVHPLLRHPRPIKRDSAKAQRMLGLIADSEEKLKGLQREKSVTTRWLERPMYGHLEVSDVESEREGDAQERVDEKTYEMELAKVVSHHRTPVERSTQEEKTDDDADLLDKWTNPERPTSINPAIKQALMEPKTMLDSSFIKRRPEPLRLPRPVSYNAQHLLSPEWSASPATMSPHTLGQRPASSYHSSPGLARSSLSSTDNICECSPPITHQQTWPVTPLQRNNNVRPERPTSFHTESSASFESPPQQRPRPTSFATYHQRNRSGSKIASSRGLRNNSYPNYSRPMSGVAVKTVPGENIENDMTCIRSTDEDVEPPSPVSPISDPVAMRETQPIHDVLAAFEIRDDKDKAEKKSKNRWSSIPQLVKRVAGRRKSSAASHSAPSLEVQDLQKDNSGKLNLTEEDLECYEREGLQIPSTPRSLLSAVALVPTPTYSPVDVNHQPRHETRDPSAAKLAPLPLPFAPWAGVPLSPAFSTENRRRSSGASSSSQTRNTLTLHSSYEATPQARPTSGYSHRSSIVLASPPSTSHSTFEVSGSPRTMSRRGTPLPYPTCIMCKTSRPPCDFVGERITANCWHEPATCVQCLQTWVYKCVQTQGWDHCTCPECGEIMAHEDVTAFAGAHVYVR